MFCFVLFCFVLFCNPQHGFSLEELWFNGTSFWCSSFVICALCVLVVRTFLLFFNLVIFCPVKVIVMSSARVVTVLVSSFDSSCWTKSQNATTTTTKKNNQSVCKILLSTTTKHSHHFESFHLLVGITIEGSKIAFPILSTFSLWQFFKHTEQFQFPVRNKRKTNTSQVKPFFTLVAQHKFSKFVTYLSPQKLNVWRFFWNNDPNPVRQWKSENLLVCLVCFGFKEKQQFLFSRFTSHFFNCCGLSFITCCWTLALDIILFASCGLIVVTLNFKSKPFFGHTLFCIFDLVVVCQTKSQQKNQMVSQQTNKKTKTHNTNNCPRVFVLIQDFFVLVWGCFVCFWMSQNNGKDGSICLRKWRQNDDMCDAGVCMNHKTTSPNLLISLPK